ncbi:MAG: hypothetical protein F6K00_19520 [Leptolyngbya sp. SIOISBB]|nr:hypothetical protein [Leptolyngbya sp. SIOISBB]
MTLGQLQQLEARIEALEMRSANRKGSEYRQIALALAAIAAVFILSPKSIETRWGSYQSGDADFVGIASAVGAIAALYQGRKKDAED